MNIAEKRVVKSLEKRIRYYRCCIIGAFILGSLIGTDILCGESQIAVPEWLGLPQIDVKVLFCFLVAATGISTGSAYRRRIRLLREHLNVLLSDSRNQKPYRKPVRDHFIAEIQVLFGMLFLLAAASVCIQYPVPSLPCLPGSNLVRLALIAGFLVLCRISVSVKGKISPVGPKPLRKDATRLKRKDGIERIPPATHHASTAKNRYLRQPESEHIHDNRTVQP